MIPETTVVSRPPTIGPLSGDGCRSRTTTALLTYVPGRFCPGRVLRAHPIQPTDQRSQGARMTLNHRRKVSRDPRLNWGATGHVESHVAGRIVPSSRCHQAGCPALGRYPGLAVRGTETTLNVQV